MASPAWASRLPNGGNFPMWCGPGGLRRPLDPLEDVAFAPATGLAPVLAAAAVAPVQLEADLLAAVAVLATLDTAAALRPTIAFGVVGRLGRAGLVGIDLQVSHCRPSTHTASKRRTREQPGSCPLHLRGIRARCAASASR